MTNHELKIWPEYFASVLDFPGVFQMNQEIGQSMSKSWILAVEIYYDWIDTLEEEEWVRIRSFMNWGYVQ